MAVTKKKVTKKPHALKGRTRTPPFPNYPEWSQARFWGFVRSALRSAYNRYPPKFAILNGAKRSVSGKGNRKWEYQCNECKGWFVNAEVSVDHVIPAGALNSYEDLPGFVERLFCSQDELQVLCDGCHKVKTAEERKKND